MRRGCAVVAMMVFLLAGLCPAAGASVIRTHAFSLVGAPKYGPDFRHFDYVNPHAPKGGTMRRAFPGSFDSLNSFAVKGIAAKGIGLIYDSLLKASDDEPSSYYGLVACGMAYPEDFSWVAFDLRKEARFSDGTPLTAEDVVYSFYGITKVSPSYRNYFKRVEKVEALGRHRVKFTFRQGDGNREMPLIAGQLKILPRHRRDAWNLEKSSLDIPVGSGPYRITRVKAGKQVVMERVPDYWGKDLPVNVGLYNVDRVVMEYFKDQTVSFEAFKAGHYDLRGESAGKRWYKGYRGKNVEAGLIRKMEIPHRRPRGMAGIVMNSSSAPLDRIEVRQALTLAYDFEWINKNIRYGQDIRHDSYFSNSELAASGLPSPEERRVLSEVRDLIRPEVLTTPFRLPRTNGTGVDRRNLIEAVTLLQKTGYRFSGGRMTGPDGRPLALEILISSKSLEKRLLPFRKNLLKIGVDLAIRYVDSTQFVEKVRSRDYQMVWSRFSQSLSPGNEQRNMWHSASAGVKGSRNYAEIRDPAVDRLVEKLIEAPDRDALIVRCRALDRVLLWGHYVIPGGYTNRYRIACWDKFGMPDKPPAYSLNLYSWWVDPAKEAALAEKMGR